MKQLMSLKYKNKMGPFFEGYVYACSNILLNSIYEFLFAYLFDIHVAFCNLVTYMRVTSTNISTSIYVQNSCTSPSTNMYIYTHIHIQLYIQKAGL